MDEFWEPVGWFAKSTDFPPRVVHIRIRVGQNMMVCREEGAFLEEMFSRLENRGARMGTGTPGGCVRELEPVVVLTNVSMAGKDLGSTAILFTGGGFEDVIGFAAWDERADVGVVGDPM